MSFILILPLDIHSDKSHSFYDKIYFIIFLKIILSNYFRESRRTSGCLVINSANNKVGLICSGAVKPGIKIHFFQTVTQVALVRSRLG